MHNAAKMLSAAQSSKVSSGMSIPPENLKLLTKATAIIFGDPDNGQKVGSISAANTKVICHTGDNICAGGATILTPHLTYSRDAATAANFAATAAGMRN